MKWFKHLVRSTSDPDILESEMKFGATGPYVFWRTIEILANEDAVDTPLTINKKVFKCFFPAISQAKLSKVLHFFNEKLSKFEQIPRISYSDFGENIVVFCHKLSLISDTYTKKVRTKVEPCAKNVHHIDKEVEVDKDIAKAIGGRSFKKPTVEEVRAYCLERKNSIDAEAFISFYESKGWRIGNQPMKAWKAAIITWEKRNAKNSNKPDFRNKAEPGKYAQFERQGSEKV